MRGLTRRAGSLQPAPPLPRQCTVVPWVRLAVGGWRALALVLWLWHLRSCAGDWVVVNGSVLVFACLVF